MARVQVRRIQVSASKVAGEIPPAGLEHGELFVNTADLKLFAGVDGGPAVAIGDIYSVPIATTSLVGGIKTAADFTLNTDGTVATISGGTY